MESFNQLMKKYEPMIWKIIQTLHIYKNKEEFYQIGLIALWEANKRFDAKKGNITGYAYTYIRGKIQSEMTRMNHYKEHMVFPKTEFWNLIKDGENIPLETESILSLCKDLTMNQKKWVLYTLHDDFTTIEIARKEKVSLSAVKDWKKGAKEKLRKILKNDD
ncbi:sigma-70 family RNA polymerase sigma factor [Bacillus sp. 31A1R]|uniref:Sigma-70 family RNA polymerase sigma factor n=1 Tax=Robertmurraya mangrovi TaxID=3098077 RepID=A0ABU5J1N6_9BACI|nr:sigma-70 family RNA polymerase sigma factor [Bacillus sp. 31A1R]MDZ5473260.1 sigma-70 family RNA polymerase sigma factor [Bacillus sp. 31A1R]